MSDAIDWQSRSAHVRRLPVYQPPLPCDVERSDDLHDGPEFAQSGRLPVWQCWLIVGCAFWTCADVVLRIIERLP